MSNFFSKVNNVDTNSTYHNPYKYLATNNFVDKSTERLGDFETTLWLETAGLIVFMSVVMLMPTLF